MKQHLAAIRMLFDWLVTGQIVDFNPASAVRGPKHVVKKDKTPVLTAEEARHLRLNLIPPWPYVRSPIRDSRANVAATLGRRRELAGSLGRSWLHGRAGARRLYTQHA